MSFSGSVPVPENGLSVMSGMNIQAEDRVAVQAQARDWLVRLTSGHATTRDADAFKAWCRASPLHAHIMADTARLWDLSRPAAQSLARQYPVQARSRPFGAVAVSLPRPGRRAFLGALAAGVAAYAVVRPPAHLWPALSDVTADYRTGTGEQRQVVLGQAVTVEMNTQTSFNLRQSTGEDRFATGNPSVELELLKGEAQVRLRPDSSARLRLVAGEGQLSALAGSDFNIRATGPRVCVTCLAGSVELNLGGSVRTAKANEQVIYGRDGVTEDVIPDLSAVSAWRDQVLVLNNLPLSEAVAEINRYRPGRIIVTSVALGRRKVQAQLRLDQLADVAELLRANYGASVRMLPGGVILLG